MNKVLQDLYRGRIPGWDSQIHSTGTEEIRKKTLVERKRLMSLMSPKAVESFKRFEALHYEYHAQRYENVYTNTFKMGVLLMCAVFMSGEAGQ